MTINELAAMTDGDRAAWARVDGSVRPPQPLVDELAAALRGMRENSRRYKCPHGVQLNPVARHRCDCNCTYHDREAAAATALARYDAERARCNPPDYVLPNVDSVGAVPNCDVSL